MKKKILAVFLSLCVAMSLLPTAAMAAPTDGSTVVRIQDTESWYPDATRAFMTKETYWFDQVTAQPAGYVVDESGKTVSISTPEALVWWAKQVNQGNSFEGYTVCIMADLDMSAHYWTPICTGKYEKNSEGKWVVTENKVLDNTTICGNGHTITGLATSTGLRGPNQDSKPGDGSNCYYDAAFIGYSCCDIKICDLAFDGARIAITEPFDEVTKTYGSSMVAVVVGAQNKGSLTLNNVTVNNADVLAMQKASAFVGNLMGNSTLTVNKCAVTNSTFSAYFMVAPIASYGATTQVKVNGIQLKNNTINVVEQASQTYSYDETLRAEYWDGNLNASTTTVFYDTTKPLVSVAELDGYGFVNLGDAITAAEDGDTITMLKEYDATSEGTITFNADKDVTLDLGGFELTLSRFDLVQGRLTVKNGSVASNPTNGQAFNVYAGPDATGELYTKLVIEDDVTINAAYGICLFPEPNSNAGYNSSIEVYGKIESGGIFVSGNLGNDTKTAGDMASSNKIPTITIHEGAVVSNGTEGQGIAMNGLANVTVNGGTVSGSEAIGVKRGTLTVNGGTFLSNGEYVNPVEANNNGTEDTGATISITSTYNYAGTINVNLNGGTFTSENAPAVYQGHSKSGETTKPYTQGVTLNIQGGTFTSPANVATVYVADEAAGDAESYTKQVISGGSFKESVAQYVTSDLKYEANANGTYTYHETLDEALAFSNNVSSVEAAKPGATFVTVTVKNGNDVDTIKLTSGTEYSLLDYPDQGYNHFQGWTDQAGNHYYGGQTVKIEKDTTFTAVWTYIPPANPNYRIDIPDFEGGTVTADPAAAKAGATVTLTATPDEGYAVGTITVTDRFGDAVKVTENADGTYTFTMPNGQVTVKATFVETEEPAPAEPFPDVDENDWFYDEVVYVYENGLMNGVENNQFAPNTATNRAMLATILYRLAGEPAVSGDLPFTDVESGTWYTDAVLWAAQNGIVNGLGENTFAPMNTLTREQLVTMLYRYAEAKGYDVSASADLSGYPDAGQVQDYAQPAMAWAVAENIIQGMEDGTLKPAGNASRAQIATILMRFCEDVAQ